MCYSYFNLKAELIACRKFTGPSCHAVWDIGLNHMDSENVGIDLTKGMDVCSSIHHHHLLATLSLMLYCIITEKVL
jgi:hypothetical protein